MWRRIGAMADEMRPDRIGVIFTIEAIDPPNNPFEKRFVVGRALNSLADLDSPGAQKVIQIFIDQGDLPVWLSHQQERRLLHPYPALRDAILRKGSAPPIHLAAQVRLWQQRLNI